MKTTVLITGSTDGIGKQTAHELAMAEYQVIIHGKDIERVENTVDEIKNASKNDDIEGFASDFESLKDVSILAKKIKDKYDQLDILINNAGIFSKQHETTQDGFEKTFQVNHLSHFLLTNLLMDLIQKSDKGKIVNVSSMVHATAIDFDNLQGEQDFEGSEAYALSKLCNVLFTYKLDRMLDKDKTTVYVVHPGVINTKLLRSNWGGIGGSVKEGAENVLYVATYEEIDHVSGKYFVNKMPQSSATVTYETDKQDKLWEVSKDMVKDYLQE
jgi:NAD(P)-dependent dehydrogenase (short-subunit alcohol dehydrogenase family)